MSSPRLPLSSRPTFLPDEISRREFATVFRGYDPAEVRTFLNQLSEQSSEMGDRVAEFQKVLTETEERVKNPELTEEMVTQLLGEQTAQILRSAREAANETRRKADEEVGRQLRDAHEVTSRMKEEAETLLAERTEEAERMAETVRADAAKDAEEARRSANEDATNIRNDVASEAERRRAELDAEIMRKREHADREINDDRTRARQQARDLIDTARTESQALIVRTQERQADLIEGLVRKRKIALAQLESLRAGRQRLLGAYKMVRTTLDDVTIELEKVEEEARQTGLVAGQRAATASEIDVESLNTVVEVEHYELNDDVPQRVIDMADDELQQSLDITDSAAAGRDADTDDDQPAAFETDAPSVVDVDALSPTSRPAPFDFDAQVNEDVVNLTVVQPNEGGASHGGGAPYGGDTSLPSAPTSILTREHTEQQQALSVVMESDSDVDFDDDDDDEISINNDVVRSGPTSLIIGEAYAGGAGGQVDHGLKLRRDAVVGKARAQATRRLKRSLQDEQDAVVARLRGGEFKSIQALLGSPDDQFASYHRAVVKLLREVARTGATSVQGSVGVERGMIDRIGTSAARRLAEQLVSDLRQRLVPVLESLLATDQMPGIDSLQHQVAEPYRYMKGDYLENLVDERVGQVFDEGVTSAR